MQVRYKILKSLSKLSTICWKIFSF